MEEEEERLNLSRSRDDELFGPVFAELEELLTRPGLSDGHPPREVLRAYLERSLEEELVSVVSLHALLCADCQSRLWRERLKGRRRLREERWGRWTIDRRAAFAYATVGIVLGLSLALLGGITWTPPPVVPFAGGGGYPPPRPF